MAVFNGVLGLDEKLPDYTALDKSYAYDGDVIIIGADAGLAAASIEENDIEYIVLEATDHYGGRLQEDRDFADFPIDLGAEWIHNNPEILDILSGEDGVSETMDLVPHRFEDVYLWDGEEHKEVPQSVLRNGLFRSFLNISSKTAPGFPLSHICSESSTPNPNQNSPVTQIDYSADTVEVTTQSGDVFEADKVLVTVSVGVLEIRDNKVYP